MNRYEKIATLCKQRKISIRRLESDLGFSNGYISKMKNSTPNADAVSKIAWYFQVPAESLENDESRNEEWIKKYVERPLYRASAGQGAYNETYTSESVSMGEEGYEYATVVGDSMLPELRDGDVIKIEPTSQTSPKDYTLIKINGDDCTVKFVEVVENGIWIRALNKEVFEDRFYSIQEVLTLPITIIGKVVAFRRTL